MAGPFSGRKVRIKYDADGAGAGLAVEIARAKVDSMSLNNEGMDITTKDDGPWRQMLNDVGVKSMELSCSGILSDQHKTLIGLYHAAGDGAALHTFEFDMPTVGTFRGLFFIKSFSSSGSEGSEAATFEASFDSAGDITWTPAV